MIKKDVLGNGVRVVTEEVASVRSVSIGVWVDVGSRDECPGEEGVSHFIEHMVFKGTRRRSAEAISREIDALGGELNAFTSRECTTFYSTVLDEYVAEGIDLLADIFHHSRFDSRELSKEKRVVLEEIPELRCHLITDTWEVRWQPGHPVSHSPPGLPRPQVFSDGSTRCRGPVAEFTCWGESGRHYSLPPAPPCAEPAATSRPTGVSRSAVRHRLAERS